MKKVPSILGNVDVSMSPEELDFRIEEIKQDIRNLRDSNYHVCPSDECQKADDNVSKEERLERYTLENIGSNCTCEFFDRVNDKLDLLVIDIVMPCWHQ